MLHLPSQRKPFSTIDDEHWIDYDKGPIPEVCMRHRAGRLLILAAFVLVLSESMFAHHGLSAYYEKNPVTLKGTVTDFKWSNPHTQIYFDVKDDNGKVTHWACETLNPARLLRAGWTKHSLNPGDQITITLIAAQNGAPVGFLRKLVLADGTELGVMQQEQ
jgi:hypothetical protein